MRGPGFRGRGMIARRILLMAAVLCACEGDRRTASTAARDSAKRTVEDTSRDSAADPPCLASHVGLPCQ